MAWFGLGYMPWLFGSGSSSGGRYNTPGIAGGTFGDLGPPPTFAFDEEEARRRARRAGLGALTAGMLEAYLNRGQGVGDAFAAQQRASALSYEQAREQAREKYGVEHQTWADRYSQERDRLTEERAAEDQRLQRERDERERKLFSEQESERERVRTARERAAAQAPSVYESIVGEFGPNSTEARQAKAVLQAGGDDVLDDLRDLYTKGVDARERRANVEADNRRSDAYLGIARDNAADRRDPDEPKRPTVAQFANDVEQEINLLVAKSLNFREQQMGVSATEMAKKRAAVYEQAVSNVKQRYDTYEHMFAGSGSSDGAGSAGTGGGNSVADVERILGRPLSAAERAQAQEALGEFPASRVAGTLRQLGGSSSSQPADRPLPVRGKDGIYRVSGSEPPPVEPPASLGKVGQQHAASIAAVEKRIHRNLTATERAQAIMALQSGVTVDALVRLWL